MRSWLKKWWPILRLFFGAALLVAIGRQFARDLGRPDLWQFSLRPEWLALSAVLYLVGLGFSALFWHRLLHRLHQQPALLDSIRAYYVGHLGKHLPGKAWALFLRTTLIQGPKVRFGVAGLATFYEVLATMAAGIVVAALVIATAPSLGSGSGLDRQMLADFFTLRMPSELAQERSALLLACAVLILPTGLPILPPVFNRLVFRLGTLRRLVTRDADGDAAAAAVPQFPWGGLGEGLVLAGIGWLFLGASLGAVLQALMPASWAWTGEGDRWLRQCAFLAVAYVAGFVFVIVPNGLGVREYFLTWFLTPELAPDLNGNVEEARAMAIVAVLVLRLIWSAAELLLAAGLYWTPVERREPHP